MTMSEATEPDTPNRNPKPEEEKKQPPPGWHRAEAKPEHPTAEDQEVLRASRIVPPRRSAVNVTVDIVSRKWCAKLVQIVSALVARKFGISEEERRAMEAALTVLLVVITWAWQRLR